MNKILNRYGDKIIKTTGFHGADISSQRIDDLDRMALEYAIKNIEKKLTGIDAGCGLGIQSVRFALLNVNMYLLDILDIEESIKAISKALFLSNKLNYKQLDIRKLAPSDLPAHIDFAYSQRFIHYLTYKDAFNFIATISKIMQPKGRIFISASGMKSELSTEYKGNNYKIEERYFKLSTSMARKHNILEKVCLYSKEELSEMLTNNNFKIEKIWESEFKNIKAIAIKR